MALLCQEICGSSLIQRYRDAESQRAKALNLGIPCLFHTTEEVEIRTGALGDFLRHPSRRERLMQRTCVSYIPSYAFDENPPLDEILKPKILCKDIGQSPWFVVDDDGGIVPRHSVYYLVPRDSARLHELCEYLNSDDSREWLIAHCQRAANGFLRLQSYTLKQLPIPGELLDQHQLAPA